MSETVSTTPKLSTTKDLTVGNPKRNILSFALPIFLSQLFQQLYNTADSLIVGNFLDKTALAAVSSSSTLIFLLVSFFEGCAAGAGVVIARYFGAGNDEKVSKAIHNDVIFGLFFGVALTVVGVAASPAILKLMKTDPAVLPQSIDYFRYYFIGALAVVMYNIFTGIMRAVGDSKRPLIYLIISSVLNVLLDLLFVGVFKWGVGAAAIATTISQAFSAVLCLIQLCKKGTVYRLSVKKLRLDLSIFKEILRNGLPTGVQNSVIGLANVIIQSYINAFGAGAMAGYGTYVKIEGFAFLPINCFSLALSTFIGQNLGAAKYDRAKSGAKFGIIVAPLLAELIGVVIYFTIPYLLALFNRDPEVIAYGTEQAHIITLFYFLVAFSHSVAAVCRGAGKAAVPMLIMLTCWFIIRIIYITVITRFFGEIKFIYWAYPITWLLSSLMFLIYFFKSDWIHGFEKKLFPHFHRVTADNEKPTEQ